MKLNIPQVNMPPKLQTLNLKLVALGCAGLFLFGLIFAYVIFPPILRAILVSVSIFELQMN